MILISSIYQKSLKTSLVLYRWQFDMKEISALHYFLHIYHVLVNKDECLLDICGTR